MHLLIDQGNTTTKYFVMNEKDEIIFHSTSANIETTHIKKLIEKYLVQHTLLSTVRADYSTVKKELSNINVLFFDNESKLPIINLYSTPETLGKDRIAGVCGAAKLFPNQNCLVIDMGTCITYDFIDAEKKYYGGSISPGLEMRLKAMHTFTGKLPHASMEWVKDFVGNNTLTSLQTGALHGTAHEIDGFINKYKKRFGAVKAIMCGGNTEFLANRCESEIFAAPNLVITGLNEILKHNLPHGA